MAKGKEKKQEVTPRDQLISWVKSIAGALVLWLILRTFLIGAFHITSGSMEETLLVGDVLFVNKALYGSDIPIINKRIPGFREPRRLDIVVFDSAEEPGLTVVKRLIGVPGDTIEMRDNVVLINNTEMVEPYLAERQDPGDLIEAKMRVWQSRYFVGSDLENYAPSVKNWGPLLVPADSFLVMGDNRNSSYDSRWWGFLGRDRIEGRALIVYFSYDRNGLLPLPFLTAIRWRRFFTVLR